MQTPDYDIVATGARLKGGMDAQGISIEELAYKSGFAAESVRSWIAGRRAMTLDAAIKVCDVLGWPLDRLVSRGDFAPTEGS
ncbi:MAG: helix-turn-helix transcriptional regulator [Atopobiaceae bacterium]|nr:helix-turn-helix transcriptional regulator [Atopobiaceae bacterium]